MDPWRRLYFNLIAPVYTVARRPGRDELEIIRQLLAPPAQGRILDLGAGAGHHARRLLWQHPDLRVTALEPALLFRVISRTLAAAAGLQRRLDHRSETAERLPFPDGCFDGALCLFVLWSIRDPRLALKELSRVLKPGAPLVVGEFAQASPPGRQVRLPFGRPPLGGQEDLAALVEPYFDVEDTVLRSNALFARCRKKISPDSGH